jgi:hypothetical protein
MTGEENKTRLSSQAESRRNQTKQNRGIIRNSKRYVSVRTQLNRELIFQFDNVQEIWKYIAFRERLRKEPGGLSGKQTKPKEQVHLDSEIRSLLIAGTTNQTYYITYLPSVGFVLVVGAC